MFTQSNPQVPGSSHPVYEWQTVTVIDSFPGFGALLRVLAVLPLLGMLTVLATSVAALFRGLSPGLVLLKRVAAGWGLAIQFFFDILVAQIFAIGYARTDLGGGFVCVLIGFLVILVGTLRPQTIFTPLACVFLATGSVILGLGWLLYGGFLMFPIVIWLPMMFLFGGLALLMTRQWTAVALILPIVMTALYGLYFFMSYVIRGFILDVPDITFIALLILLNGGTLWLTRRSLKRASLTGNV